MRVTMTHPPELVGHLQLRSGTPGQRSRYPADYEQNAHRIALAIHFALKVHSTTTACGLLTRFRNLQARLRCDLSPRPIIAELLNLEHQANNDDQMAATARTLRRTLELCYHILDQDPEQLPLQLLARLDNHLPVFQELLSEASRSTTWGLRPVRPCLWNEGGAIVDVIDLGGGTIIDAAFSTTEDAFWILRDGELVLWHTARKTPIKRYPVAYEPTALAVSGAMLAVATRDGPVHIWDIDQDERLHSLQLDRATLAIAFLNDGTLLTAGTEGILRQWNARSGEIINEVVCPGSIGSLAVLGPKHAIIGGDADAHGSSVRIVDCVTGQFTQSFGNYDWDVDCLALNESRSLLAVGANTDIAIWRVEDGECVHRMRLNTKCQDMLFMQSQVLTATSSGDLQLWCAETGHEVARLPSHAGLVSALALRSGDGTLLTASWDQFVRVWNTRRIERSSSLRHDEQVTCVAFNLSGDLCVTGSQDGSLIIWDVLKAEPIRRLSGHQHWVSDVHFSDVVVSSSWDGTIRMWNWRDGTCLGIFVTHSQHVARCALTPDSDIVASIGVDGIVGIWNLRTREMLLKCHTRTKDSIAAQWTSATRLVLATRPSKLVVYDVKSGICSEQSIASITATACSISENSIVLGLGDGSIFRLQGDGSVLEKLGSEGCAVAAVAQTQSGLILTAGGIPMLASDNTMRLWSKGRAMPLAHFVGDAAFTAAGIAEQTEHVVLGDVTGNVMFLTYAVN